MTDYMYKLTDMFVLILLIFAVFYILFFKNVENHGLCSSNKLLYNFLSVACCCLFNIGLKLYTKYTLMMFKGKNE